MNKLTCTTCGKQVHEDDLADGEECHICFKRASKKQRATVTWRVIAADRTLSDDEAPF